MPNNTSSGSGTEESLQDLWNFFWKFHPHEKLIFFKHTGYWKGVTAFGASLVLTRRAPQLATRFLPAAAQPTRLLRTAWYWTSPVLSTLLGVGVATRNTNFEGLANDVAKLPLCKDSAIADSYCEKVVDLFTKQDVSFNPEGSFVEKSSRAFFHNCHIRAKANDVVKHKPGTDWNDAVNSVNRTRELPFSPPSESMVTLRLSDGVKRLFNGLYDGTLLQSPNQKPIQLADALGEKEFILLYASAHWCPPCRQFTPMLANW